MGVSRLVTSCPLTLPRRKRAQREDCDMAQGLPVSVRFRGSRPRGRSAEMALPSGVTRAAAAVGPVAVASYRPESELADSFLLQKIRNGVL